MWKPLRPNLVGIPGAVARCESDLDRWPESLQTCDRLYRDFCASAQSRVSSSPRVSSRGLGLRIKGLDLEMARLRGSFLGFEIQRRGPGLGSSLSFLFSRFEV